MNVPDRRGLNLGIALTALGLFFLLRRELHLSGPGPILLLIGTVLFAIFGPARLPRPGRARRGAHRPRRRGSCCATPSSPGCRTGRRLLLFLGGGLLLAAAVDRFAGRERHPSTLAPGLVLVAIAAVTAFAQNIRIPESLYEIAWRLWPWALVAAGVLLVVQGMRGRRSAVARRSVDQSRFSTFTVSFGLSAAGAAATCRQQPRGATSMSAAAAISSEKKPVARR